ncbi:hypothetical protein V8F06_014053 [Rhypophila decipiens]
MAPTARFSTCSVPECARPRVRGGSCTRCKRHLCTKHRSRQYHQCPPPSEVSKRPVSIRAACWPCKYFCKGAFSSSPTRNETKVLMIRLPTCSPESTPPNWQKPRAA